MNSFVFTSESVTEGHPDKIADQISDAVLDAILAADPDARVACETLVTTGLACVAGEITTNTYVSIPDIVRGTISSIGYNDASFGFDGKTCAVLSTIDRQSPDIAQGVDTGGAGDQGMMFGYASDETPELMPMPIQLAHRLTQTLAERRKSGALPWLRPDGKAQIIVDTYGGAARHGGGAFSGKDPSKVDRSAAYAARWVAKNVVAAGFAKRCEVQLAYAIGVVEPVSIMVDTFNTCTIPESTIRHAIREVFDLSPRGIIKALGLRSPIYRRTASGGHFGRSAVTEKIGGASHTFFTWERTDRIDDLRTAAESSRA